MDDKNRVAAFIERWRGASGSERANYQLFVAGLCDLLEVPHPEPAHEDTRDNAFVFERRVVFSHGDGSTSNGFIDCYKRGAFVLEAKKLKAGAHTKGFDDALLRARAQAEGYARALPAAEGRQAAHESVTLTGLYNVLEKLRSGEPFTAKDKLIHEQGLVSVLKSLHDELDAAVLGAYGWSDLLLSPNADAAARAAMTDSLLERLVALNARRAAEEAAGTVRWLRPEFQQRPQAGEQVAMDVTTDAAPQAAAPLVAVPLVKRAWPGGLPEQIKAVAEVLAASPLPLSLADLEARFTARGRWRERLPTIIETLEALGRARSIGTEAKAWQAA